MGTTTPHAKLVYDRLVAARRSKEARHRPSHATHPELDATYYEQSQQRAQRLFDQLLRKTAPRDEKESGPDEWWRQPEWRLTLHEDWLRGLFLMTEDPGGRPSGEQRRRASLAARVRAFLANARTQHLELHAVYTTDADCSLVRPAGEPDKGECKATDPVVMAHANFYRKLLQRQHAVGLASNPAFVQAYSMDVPGDGDRASVVRWLRDDHGFDYEEIALLTLFVRHGSGLIPIPPIRNSPRELGTKLRATLDDSVLAARQAYAYKGKVTKRETGSKRRPRA